eukprot:TRINITY_DN83_c0_g1_i3.p1 TRINITY_DN83_c0_g1~~TRINITY_DN83_c0_g1_i3.p1  ORF type:complete len:255 (+),score=62.13 TRINITY_DN83_c0_g1_i3:47-766(+)
MASSECCDNPPTLSSSSGSGRVEQIGGIKAYTTGSLDSKLAVVFISDIFGYEGPNVRKIADKVAAAGFFVVIPDFFHGDPYDPDNVEKPIPVWLESHGPDKGYEDSKPIIAELKSKGITAIGAAGFCWGAKVVVELGKSGDIQAAVLLHPSFVTVDDIKEVKVPISILGAEIDKMSPPELLKEFEELLSTSGVVDHFVKIFPGVSHGWTVRYDVGNEHGLKSAEESHGDLLAWFTKYVK